MNDSSAPRQLQEDNSRRQAELSYLKESFVSIVKLNIRGRHQASQAIFSNLSINFIRNQTRFLIIKFHYCCYLNT